MKKITLIDDKPILIEQTHIDAIVHTYGTGGASLEELEQLIALGEIFKEASAEVERFEIGMDTVSKVLMATRGAIITTKFNRHCLIAISFFAGFVVSMLF